jgi:hypothetical protein
VPSQLCQLQRQAKQNGAYRALIWRNNWQPEAIRGVLSFTGVRI